MCRAGPSVIWRQPRLSHRVGTLSDSGEGSTTQSGCIGSVHAACLLTDNDQPADQLSTRPLLCSLMPHRSLLFSSLPLNCLLPCCSPLRRSLLRQPLLAVAAPLPPLPCRCNRCSGLVLASPAVPCVCAAAAADRAARCCCGGSRPVTGSAAVAGHRGWPARCRSAVCRERLCFCQRRRFCQLLASGGSAAVQPAVQPVAPAAVAADGDGFIGSLRGNGR